MKRNVKLSNKLAYLFFKQSINSVKTDLKNKAISHGSIDMHFLCYACNLWEIKYLEHTKLFGKYAKMQITEAKLFKHEKLYKRMLDKSEKQCYKALKKESANTIVNSFTSISVCKYFSDLLKNAHKYSEVLDAPIPIFAVYRKLI